MKAHIIEDGIVVNTIEVDDLDFLPGLVEATEGGIGWSYSNGVFTEPLPIAPTRAQLKSAREIAVAAIIVTTESGKSFDGDETSQTRITRAIVALQASTTSSMEWTLSDNTVQTVTLDELIEALILAGQAQSRLWAMSLNFVIYDKTTGAIREQRSASGCFTEADIMASVYGESASEMAVFMGAIPMLDQVKGDGSLKVNTVSKAIIPTPGWVAPVPAPVPVPV